MSLLRELLTRAINLSASDVHITSDQVPMLRIRGDLSASGMGVLTVEEVNNIVNEILPQHTRRRYDIEHEADFSLQEEDVGRFRVNIFVCHGKPALALRHVKTAIPTFEDLRLPLKLKELAMTPRGIILASGTTGSGKSTTLAAMLNEINQHRKCRVITIEDPIEYIFEDNLALISQREVGLDTMSFHAALKHVLRQDPDVIMIGEMRDAESFMAALSAAETGHLIFSTLHTGSAAQSITRILDFFPASERNQIRMSLSANVRAVICQRLIPCIDGAIVPAVELMVNNSTVTKIIEKNVLGKLEAAVETGGEDGMQTFNQSIYKLIRGGLITEEDGLRRATNPEALKMNLKGIFLDEDKRILAI